MRGANHNASPFRLEVLVQSVGDLLSHAFLHLQPLSECVHRPRQLGQANHSLAWPVANCSGSNKREHVVFAQRRELDAINEHEPTMSGNVELDVQVGSNVVAVPSSHFSERPQHPRRSVHEPVPVGVLPYVLQQAHNSVSRPELLARGLPREHNPARHLDSVASYLARRVRFTHQRVKRCPPS